MWKVSVAAWPSLGCLGARLVPTFCFADLSLFVGVVTDRFWGERDWATPLRDSSHAFCMHGDGRFFFKKAEKDYGMLKLVTGGSLTITIGWEDPNRLDLTWYHTTFLRPIRPSYAGLATGCTCIPHAVPCLPASSCLGVMPPVPLARACQVGSKPQDGSQVREHANAARQAAIGRGAGGMPGRTRPSPQNRIGRNRTNEIATHMVVVALVSCFVRRIAVTVISPQVHTTDAQLLGAQELALQARGHSGAR